MLVALLLTAAVVAVGLEQRSLAEDWPRWRGPRGDGSWRAPKLPERWPAAGLRVRWRKPVGGGYAGVSVAAGVVYVMDRRQPDESPAGAEVERVLAFDASTGDALWEHAYPARYENLDYGNGPRAAATVDAGRVYTLGALGHACCLDAKSGRVIWEKDFLDDTRAGLPEWGLAASPLVFNDLVVFHPGARPNGCLVALDKVTGDEAWRASSDPGGYATPILAEHAGRPLLVAWTPEHILGLDPRGGDIHWSVPYKVTYGVSIATPVLVDDIVFVAGYWEGSKAIRLGAESNDAKVVWEDNRQLRGLMSQPLTRDGYGYLLDKQHGLTCFEIGTGQTLWNDGNQLTPRGRNPQATLVWAGHKDRIIALNAEGELILARVNPQGYHEQSRTKIIGPTWAHPAYAGDRVYARDDTELVAVELLSN